jgi:predicted nucleic acid-binding protein
VERLFVDTSAWLAYVDRADPHHRSMAEALRTFAGRLVTTNFVFDETVTFCVRRLGHATALLVGDLLRDPDVVDLVRVEVPDEDNAWKLLQQRDDKAYSFTDCTSFAVMQRMGLRRAATLDGDFATEGFHVVR